jgi:hypothetical protein
LKSLPLTQEESAVSITEIKEIRILPALAVGRFGSSPEPMDNYEAQIDENDLTGFKKLVPAETLIVNRDTGEITGSITPAAPVKFRDGNGHVRPVAPFFEVWARFTDEGSLEPLTLAHLSDLQASAADVQWRVRAANHKAFRRTADSNDKIEIDTSTFSDHAVKELKGVAPNFKVGKSIPFGSVQYIKPTDAFPEIRARFTPPAGKVYGPKSGDANVVDDVYDAASGSWDGHRDGEDGNPFFTQPGGIYAADPNGSSLGYLDDACDGIIECRVKGLSAIARFSSGPPAFAPDSFPVRTVADELEQMLLGPEVPEAVAPQAASDIIRHALDTVRLMNTDAMNRSGMPNHDGRLGRAREPIFQPVTRAQYALVRMFHQSVLQTLEGLNSPAGSPERENAVFALRRILELVRSSEDVGDLSNKGRRRMPAMMRGSDSVHLALTKRQINKLRKVLLEFDPSTGQTTLPEQNMLNFIRSHAFAALLHAGVSVGGGQTLSQLFADPAAVLNYLKTGAAQGDIVPDATGKPLVVPGNPDASAFVAIISNPDHPMNEPFSAVDLGTGKTGIQIVREWITSLA